MEIEMKDFDELENHGRCDAKLPAALVMKP